MPCNYLEKKAAESKNCNWDRKEARIVRMGLKTGAIGNDENLMCA